MRKKNETLSLSQYTAALPFRTEGGGAGPGGRGGTGRGGEGQLRKTPNVVVAYQSSAIRCAEAVRSRAETCLVGQSQAGQPTCPHIWLISRASPHHVRPRHATPRAQLLYPVVFLPLRQCKIAAFLEWLMGRFFPLDALSVP